MEHDDDRIDEALEALARPQPPADHVARILARSSALRPDWRGETRDTLLPAFLRPRWVLPVAATLLVALGAAWQIERQAQRTLDDSMALDVRGRLSGLPTWGAREDIVQPVLPPQAYWGMDPFREFATLRPGTRVTAQGPPSPKASARRRVPDDESPWEPVPTGLPPIDVVSIAPAPLLAQAAMPIEDITPAEIPLAPIVIAPLDDQERP